MPGSLHIFEVRLNRSLATVSRQFRQPNHATSTRGTGFAADATLLLRPVEITFSPSKRRVSDRVPPVSRASSGSSSMFVSRCALINARLFRRAAAPSCGWLKLLSENGTDHAVPPCFPCRVSPSVGSKGAVIFLFPMVIGVSGVFVMAPPEDCRRRAQTVVFYYDDTATPQVARRPRRSRAITAHPQALHPHAAPTFLSPRSCPSPAPSRPPPAPPAASASCLPASPAKPSSPRSRS